MPTYTITDPDNGRKVRITGDSPPTEAEINQIFAAQVSKPVQAKPVAPAPKERSAWDKLNPIRNFEDMGTAFDKNVGDLFLSAGQLALNGLSWADKQLLGDEPTISGLIAGQQKRPLERGADSLNKFIEMRQGMYDRYNTDTPGGVIGGVSGVALPFATAPGVRLMELAAAPSKLIPQIANPKGIPQRIVASASRNTQRLVGGAGQGTIAGLIQTDTSGDYSDKGSQVLTGAITGGALPVGISAGIRGAQGAGYIWDNTLGNLLESSANKKAAEIIRQSSSRPIDLMRPQPSQVPGVQRTLAEETQDEGIAGLQNVFKNPAADDMRRDANNTLRNQYLEEMTGSGRAYDDAIKFREQNNDGAFDRARDVTFSTPKPVEKPLIVLPSGVKRPEQAVEPDDLSPLLDELEKVKATFKGGNSETVVQGYINRIKGAKGNGLILDNIRRDLDFAMSQKGGDVNIRDLAMIKEKFAGFLKQNPEFNKALSGWANDSKPISRFDIGKALVAPSSRGAAQDRVGYEVLKPQAFKGRVDNLDTVAQRATGFNRAKASDYLTPDDMQKIGNVSDDLERQRFADTKGALLGSQTAQRLQANKQLENTVLSKMPIVGKAFKWLDDIGQEKLKTRLAEVLINPQQARAVLSSFPVNERLIIENAIRSMGWQGVLLGGGVR